MNAEKTKIIQDQIRQAFTSAVYPGDDNLTRSHEGDEGFLLEDDFRGKTRWQELDPAFIDRAGGGFASALAFFSDAAFRFYLPAYLIADLAGQLLYAQPLFYLYHGLDAYGSTSVNPRRYGKLTWRQASEARFAVFTQQEAEAILAYLSFQLESGRLIGSEIDSVKAAILSYWLPRAGETDG
jgi:hypothetical protein